tara:strand:+ start:232 stop:474 length:243 start_codon:yes stop_codon:yes gene_type:complete
MNSVISYIDNVDTLNKIVELTLHAKTRESLFDDVMKETRERVSTLLKDANDNLDKQALKQLGDELLKRQHERYCQRIANT